MYIYMYISSAAVRHIDLYVQLCKIHSKIILLTISIILLNN